MEDRLHKIRRILSRIIAKKGRSAITILPVDARSLVKVIAGNSEDIWSEQTLTAKLSKAYPGIDWTQFRYEYMLIQQKMIVWIYPLQYLELCREMSTEHVLFTLSAPVAFLSQNGSRQQVKLSDREWLQLQYDHDGLLSDCGFTSTSLEESDSLKTSTDYHAYVSANDAFLTTAPRQKEPLRLFMLGGLNHQLRRAVAGLAVLCLLLLALFVWSISGTEARTTMQTELKKESAEIAHLQEQNMVLRARLKNRTGEMNRQLSVRVNKLLQSRDDSTYFESMNLWRNNDGIIITVSGKTSELKSLDRLIGESKQFGLEKTSFKNTKENGKVAFELGFVAK